MRRTSLPRLLPRSHSLSCALLAVLLAVPGLTGCGGDGGGAAEPLAEEAAAQRVENASVDVAVVIPPGSPFELESNEGDEIRLVEEVSTAGHYPYLGFDAVAVRANFGSLVITAEGVGSPL